MQPSTTIDVDWPLRMLEGAGVEVIRSDDGVVVLHRQGRDPCRVQILPIRAADTAAPAPRRLGTVRMTPEEVRELRHRYATERVSGKQLALDYGISDTHAYRILHQ